MSRAAMSGVLLLISVSGWARGGVESILTVSGEPPFYISPAASPGVRDGLSAPVNVELAGRRALYGFRITVTRADGTVVHMTENSFNRREQPVTVRLLSLLPLQKRPGLERPEFVLWDGASSTGQPAADGSYLVTAEGWDNRQRPLTPAVVAVVVDNTPPQVAASVPYQVFSPNGDDRRDSLPVQIVGSSEDLWVASLRDESGTTVLEQRWANSAPTDFTWDGSDAAGREIPDGIFSLEIVSTDRAGNTGRARISDLSLSRADTPVAVTAEPAAFSPNGDGVADSTAFILLVPVRQGLLEWTLTVANTAGEPVLLLSGAQVQPRLEWDGTGVDGSLVTDGAYQVAFEVRYENGNNPRATAGPVVVDTVKPHAVLSAASSIFSPDGDGLGDTLTIAQSGSSAESSWSGRIRDAAKNLVWAWDWEGSPPDLAWDGRDSNARLLPDGAYAYQLAATDAAGNSASAQLTNLRIDRRPTIGSIRTTAGAFSPNNDGISDVLRLVLLAQPNQGLATWRVDAVAPGTGLRYPIREGARSLPATLVWDGRSNGQPVPEGHYQALLSLEYQKGNRNEERTAEFRLDVSGPTVTVTAPRSFSPDGDGRNDVLDIQLQATDDAGVELWGLLIRDRNDHAMQGFAGVGRPPAQLQWDGSLAAGNKVLSGETYSLAFTAQDTVGNQSLARTDVPIDLEVVPEGDNLRITVSAVYFAAFRPAFDPAYAAENQAILERLAETLRGYPERRLRVEGHAVRVYWDDETRGAIEEQTVLQPLSKARAETVKSALIQLGVQAARIEAQGFGGGRPIVPHNDLENRWRNRRVEILLLPES